MAGDGSTFSPPAATPAGQPSDNDVIQWFTQMITQGAGGGMGGFGGANPMAAMGGMGITPDALGMGGGADPLGLSNMLMGGGIGLNPAQAAGLRLKRSNAMNVLRQNMANQHRGIGVAGRSDFGRHVQNIDDEILALSEQKVQDNIKNALAYDQMLMNYAQQNTAKNNALGDWIAQAIKRHTLYGDDKSPGTFSGDEGGADTQGTLP